MIDRKADVELIVRLQEQKAEKHQIEHFEDELEEVNDKIKHLIVFSSELANILLPKDAEMAQTLSKREEIANLGQNIQKWILSRKDKKEQSIIKENSVSPSPKRDREWVNVSKMS